MHFFGTREQIGARLVAGAEIAGCIVDPRGVVGDARPVRPMILSRLPPDVRRSQPKSHVCWIMKKRQNWFWIFIIKYCAHPIQIFLVLWKLCPGHSESLAWRFAFPFAGKTGSHSASCPKKTQNLIKIDFLFWKFGSLISPIFLPYRSVLILEIKLLCFCLRDFKGEILKRHLNYPIWFVVENSSGHVEEIWSYNFWICNSKI